MSVASDDVEPLTFTFEDDGLIPNNPMPLLLRRFMQPMSHIFLLHAISRAERECLQVVRRVVRSFFLQKGWMSCVFIKLNQIVAIVAAARPALP
jgi:hypothetical protein